MSREVLTYSKRRDWQNCPRYFFHRHVERIRARADKPGRRKGRAFGQALEAMRQQTGQEQIDVARWAIDAAYEGLHPSSQEESDELEFEQHALLVLVLGYADRYGLQPRREIEYLLPLMNPDTGRRSRLFDIAGKIDGLELLGWKRLGLDNSPEGWQTPASTVDYPVYRLIEDKLVSQLQKPMIDRLPLDQQTSEYLDAIVAKVGTVEVEVSYRFTRWPQIRQRKNESLDEFCSRFTEDMESRREWYFVEQNVLFPTEQLEDFRRARWGLSQQIREATRTYNSNLVVQATGDTWVNGRDRLFPQNPSRCWEYGGCEYLPICCKRWGAEDLYVKDERDNPELEGRDDAVS